MRKQPKIWIVAGPNGAGKSTLVNRTRDIFSGPFVNPDVIAAELNPANRDDPETVVEAGRIALELRKDYISKSQSFGIETTLSGHSVTKMVKEIKNKGYQVNLVFVGLKNAKNSSLRVAARVREGGHNVPEDAISRRYQQSLDNLQKISPYADRLYILDNSGSKHRMLLTMEQAQVKFLNQNLPKWAENLIPSIIQQRQYLIPARAAASLDPSHLSDLVSNASGVRACRKEVEHLSRLVYGRSNVFENELGAIGKNPQEAERVKKQIETDPSSIAPLAGKERFLGKDQARKEAEAHISRLGRAIENYADASRQARHEIMNRHDAEQKHLSQAVELPNRAIQNILNLPKEQQLEALAKSPELQKQVDLYMTRIDDSLSSAEQRAISQGDTAQLAKSLNVSESRAKVIAGTINQMRMAQAQLPVARTLSQQQGISRTTPSPSRSR